MSTFEKTRKRYDIRNEPIMKEGNYTSYSENWNIDVAAGAALMTTDEFYVSGDKIIFTDLSQASGTETTYVKELSDGSAVDSDNVTVSWNQPTPKLVHASIFSRYVVRQIARDAFQIWKDGAILQTITITGVGVNIQGLNITFDGRYILICDRDNDTLYLYEGA